MTDKYNLSRKSRISSNPLLRVAGTGFPFESENSPILVPVCLNESSPEKENSLTESPSEVSTPSNLKPLTAKPSPDSKITSSTPTSAPSTIPVQQSYSSKLASYFPGVTTAFTNLTNTFTGNTSSSISSSPQTSHSSVLGTSSQPNAETRSASQNTYTNFVSPPPTSFPPTGATLPPQIASQSVPPTFIANAGLDSFSNLPPPSDPFSSISLNSSPSHSQQTPSFVNNPSSSNFFVPQSIDSLAQSTLPLVGSSSIDNLAPPKNQQSVTSVITSPLSTDNPTVSSGACNYRLKSLKRPAYAPLPGLGTTPVVSTMAPAVTPNSETTNFCVVENTPLSASSATLYDSVQSSPVLDGATEVYREVYHHWFYKKVVENKAVWHPLSMPDSLNIEEGFLDPSKSQIIPSDGGRYDVYIGERLRKAVYWDEAPTEVRRCSWFYKASLESRYIPYDEKVSDTLEAEFKDSLSTGNWQKKVSLENSEEIIMYSAKVIVHHVKPELKLTDFAWDSNSEQSIKPRIVSRGLENFDISEGEPEKIDHLLFLVHGIGSFCDLKFRPVVEVVDDFRSISLQLTSSHFKSASDEGTLGRVEMLPISWHSALHSEESGIDKKLKAVTLPSIPKLRYFTNDTLLDVLFYTSPIYCERIISAVCKEMNRLYSIFLTRNPNYNGGVSMGGHSLGSLILFDLLSHQRAPSPNLNSDVAENGDHTSDVSSTPEKTPLNKGISYVSLGANGTGQPDIKYPQLTFSPRMFFAFGSPVGMFVNVRGIDTLGEDFAFPTCPKFYNIFHPFDPVAYRIEPLLVPAMENVRPVLIPHHKGRKRMHLELKDTLEYVGTALKQKLYDSMKNTWNKVSYLTNMNKTDERATIERDVTHALEEQLLSESANVANSFTEPTQELKPGELVGKLNGGKRVDYVLQEAPLESFNEYLFALSSHVCYWESNDTMLMVLKEIYADLGVSADNQVPQQILPFDISQTDSSGHNETGSTYEQTQSTSPSSVSTQLSPPIHL